MTRRIIYGMVCGIFLVCSAIFAGCSMENSAKHETVQLTYVIWDKNQKPGMDAIAEAFHEENPDIVVDVQVVPWGQYWTKLEANAASNTMPDVCWMHSQSFLRYVNQGFLLDLTDWFDVTDAMSHVPQELAALYSKQGRVYAMPKDYDTIGLWYNKALFDEKGIAYPDENWDWGTLLEAARKLTDPAKGIYGIMAPPDQQSFYYTLVYQNGGEILHPDQQASGYDEVATQQAVQFAVDLSRKYHLSPTVQQFASQTREQYFMSGKAAMGFFGSWMLADFKANEYVAKNCDVAVLPRGKRQATIYNGLGNAVAAGTKHPAEAVRFVRFLSGEKANHIQAAKGAAIPAYKGTETAWIAANHGFNVKVYPEMLRYAVLLPNSETRDRWVQLENDCMAQIWAGNQSVAAGCQVLAARINAMLREENH